MLHIYIYLRSGEVMGTYVNSFEEFYDAKMKAMLMPETMRVVAVDYTTVGFSNGVSLVGEVGGSPFRVIIIAERPAITGSQPPGTSAQGQASGDPTVSGQGNDGPTVSGQGYDGPTVSGQGNNGPTMMEQSYIGGPVPAGSYYVPSSILQGFCIPVIQPQSYTGPCMCPQCIIQQGYYGPSTSGQGPSADGQGPSTSEQFYYQFPEPNQQGGYVPSTSGQYDQFPYPQGNGTSGQY